MRPLTLPGLSPEEIRRQRLALAREMVALIVHDGQDLAETERRMLQWVNATLDNVKRRF